MNESHMTHGEAGLSSYAHAPLALGGPGADSSVREAANDAAWEALFDALPDPVAVIDCEHRFVRVNRVLAQRLNVRRDAAIGRRCYELVHGTTSPPAFCPHSRALEDGRAHCARVYEPMLDAFFDITSTPLPDASGRLSGTVHVLHELTDERHG